MSQIVIREARSEDCDEILALWKVTGSGPSVTDTPEHLRMLNEKSRDLFLVAESGGRLIGSILGGWDNWRGHIYRPAVHPDFRRQGLASELTAEIERRLHAKGAQRIYALASAKNDTAAPFWDSRKYERSKDIPFVTTVGEE